MVDCNPFPQDNENNINVTTQKTLDKPYSHNWKLPDVKANPVCVKHFFETLKLKGSHLSLFADKKGVNRSKLSQILHSLSVPRTATKRKYWAEEVLGYDVQIFWIPITEEAEGKSSALTTENKTGEGNERD